jgi:putative salt-induced outer membrane protein YdiY
MIYKKRLPLNRLFRMRTLKNNNSIFTTATLFYLLWILSPFALHSETIALKLKNGDRFTGVIISENTNQVSFSNALTKQISIPLAEIVSREIIPAPPAATNAIAAATNTPPASTNKPAVTVNAALAQIASPKPPEKTKRPSAWHGDAQVGADIGISQVRRELYYGRFKVTYAPVHEGGPTGTNRFIERFRNTFEYNAAYGTVTADNPAGDRETKLSANKMDGSSKTDFDLGKDRRFYVYNLMGAGYDEIRKIDFRYELGPGIGYHVLTKSNLVFNTEIGMNYQVQYVTDAETTERFYYRLAEDLTWKISKTLTFDEKVEFFPKVELQEYRFRLEANLRYWLLENLSFNLTVLDLYDTQSPPNVGKNDLQIRSSIGLKF